MYFNARSLPFLHNLSNVKTDHSQTEMLLFKRNVEQRNGKKIKFLKFCIPRNRLIGDVEMDLLYLMCSGTEGLLNV